MSSNQINMSSKLREDTDDVSRSLKPGSLEITKHKKKSVYQIAEEGKLPRIYNNESIKSVNVLLKKKSKEKHKLSHIEKMMRVHMMN